MAQRGNPWSWFTTDWPLQNHFYRPVSTLSLYADEHLFGTNISAYAISASVYCALCVLAVFWLARELTNSPAASATAAVLFAVWQSPLDIAWDQIALVVAILVLGIGYMRHRAKVRNYLPAAFALAFLATEFMGVHRKEAPGGLYGAMFVWLPSRTASVLTLFALCAIAAYVRYERLGAAREPETTTPLDLPATRTSTSAFTNLSTSWIWIIIAAVFLGLALCSYEQAVMIPIILLVIGIGLAATGQRVRWKSHVVFWLILGLYVFARSRVLPQGPSDYQMQQSREGASAYLSIINYVFPGLGSARTWWSTLALGSSILLTATFYSLPIQAAGNLFTYWEAFKRNKIALSSWAASCLAFLPMAFLKPFAHYHYFPMSLRAIFVALLVGVVWKMIVSAVSPQGLQAPERRSPAPGSLHHR